MSVYGLGFVLGLGLRFVVGLWLELGLIAFGYDKP